MDLAAQDDARPEPCADRQEDEVVDAARDPGRVLADCGEIDVVLERDVMRQSPGDVPAEVVALDAGHIRRQRDPPVPVSTTPGIPMTALSISSSGRSLAAVRLDRRDAIASTSSSAPKPVTPTSWRERTVPFRSQRAPRRKRAPRSSPSTSAASGTGSKNTAP
jgi:hypothetical protein